MKLNLKVRLKNPVFWLTIVPAIIALVYSILGMLDIVPSIAESTVTELLTTIITVLTTLGVLVDPTTKGVADSERALSYVKPGICLEDDECDIEAPDGDAEEEEVLIE